MESTTDSARPLLSRWRDALGGLRTELSRDLLKSGNAFWEVGPN